MDGFWSSREFVQMPKPNQVLGDEKQLFSHQSLGTRVELQNDTIIKDNQMVDLGGDDIVGVDNLIDKPMQSDTAISDGASLEGVDIGVRVEHGLSSEGEGGVVSGICEQVGLNEDVRLKVSLEGMDVNLTFDDETVNMGEGAHVSAEIPARTSDSMFLKGVDASLSFEHGSENQGKSADGSGRYDLVETIENPKSKSALKGVDASLKYEHMIEKQGEGAHLSMKCEQPRSEEDIDLEDEQDIAKLEENEQSKYDTIDTLIMEGAQMEQVEGLQSDMLKSCGTIERNECVAIDAQANVVNQLTPPPLKIHDENMIVLVLAIPAADSYEKPRRGRKPKAASVKLESPQQYSVAGGRALRSKLKENREDAEPSADLAKGNTERRGRKKGKRNDEKSNDELSKLKKHLKYLLHRIKYEQNLLDAYSSEGWRGQSVEKLRPEKELQRAKADIIRSKLKIRDLFQRLESMSSEGKFPESLYDSDGLIDSEDIFCAKCGSKDLSPGNDILLCDGICERGFHQNCLNPPLATEEIPPGDEGWLCPACDCKVDCYNLLNDSHGTKLTIEDNWEKVFPEAVAATTGNELDDIMGLPSDDSEDNEYNPDGADDDANVEGNESRSDESDSSDFSSASEDLGAIGGGEQNLGLLSDDSEDDDFDPSAVNVNEDGVELGSSGSDFSSASEDLGAAIGGGTSDQGEPPQPLELEQDLGEASPIIGKRCVERLDYKKLYDETYGNAASDSSADEEWTDIVPTRKNSTKKTSCASASTDVTCGSGAPRRRGRPKATCQAANGSPSHMQKSSQQTNSASSDKRRPPYNRLGEAVTKRLYESFKENQYPDRETKVKLAKEVGLTLYKVDKWFGNARWSSHHHPSRVEASMNRVISGSNNPHIVACNGGETAITDNTAALPECGNADTSRKKLTPRRSRDSMQVDQSILENSPSETLKEDILGEPAQASDITQGMGRGKRRKSGS